MTSTRTERPHGVNRVFHAGRNIGCNRHRKRQWANQGTLKQNKNLKYAKADPKDPPPLCPPAAPPGISVIMPHDSGLRIFCRTPLRNRYAWLRGSRAFSHVAAHTRHVRVSAVSLIDTR